MNTSTPWDYCHKLDGRCMKRKGEIVLSEMKQVIVKNEKKNYYIAIYMIVILCYSILNEPKPPPPHPKKFGVK